MIREVDDSFPFRSLVLCNADGHYTSGLCHGRASFIAHPLLGRVGTRTSFRKQDNWCSCRMGWSPTQTRRHGLTFKGRLVLTVVAASTPTTSIL